MIAPVHQIAQDATVLAGRFERLAPGEIVGYAELDRLVSRDLRTHENRHVLNRARREAEHRGVTLVTVRKVGIKRALEDDVVAMGTDAVGRVRRMCVRGAGRLNRAAKSVVMSGTNATKVFARIAVLSTVGAMTKPKKIEAMEQVPDPQQAPVAKVLDVMRAAEGLSAKVDQPA